MQMLTDTTLNFNNVLNFEINIKGAVCRIDTRYFAVQIQNIGDVFFHQPLLLRFDAGCQINDTNRNERT